MPCSGLYNLLTSALPILF
jgi:hypothetical protein